MDIDRVGKSSLGLKAMLHDFRADRDMRFDSGVKILKYEDSDSTFFTSAKQPFALNEFYIASESGDNVTDNQIYIEQVLVLLWLYKPNPAWISTYFKIDDSIGFGSINPPRPMPDEEPCELSDKECNEFENFVNYVDTKYCFLTEKNRRYLSRALDRFENACIRNLDHLILTELVIALETLLLEKGDNLKYKLALRTAILIGRTDSERKEIFQNMKQAYNHRSSYVHGEDIKDEKVKLLCPKIRHHFSDAIIRFLSLPQDMPCGENEQNRSRVLLDETLLTHDKELKIDYPEWWQVRSFL